MFLSLLGTPERKKILELVYKIANNDRNYNKDEIRMINKFKKELGVEVIPSGSTIDALLDEMAKRPLSEQKIFLFEILGIIDADQVVSAEEEALFQKAVAKFNVSAEDIETMRAVSKKLSEDFKAARAVVLG